VIEFDKLFLRKDLEKHLRLYTGESSIAFTNKNELVEFTQNSKSDWVNKITNRPTVFYNLTPDTFATAIQILEENKLVTIISMDRNSLKRLQKLDDVLEKYSGNIRYTESD
jgi:hypothetical protein